MRDLIKAAGILFVLVVFVVLLYSTFLDFVGQVERSNYVEPLQLERPSGRN